MKRSLDASLYDLSSAPQQPKNKRLTVLKCDFCEEVFEHKRLKLLHMQVHHLMEDGAYVSNIEREFCNSLKATI